MEFHAIGPIANAYGGLGIVEYKSKYYWFIANYDSETNLKEYTPEECWDSIKASVQEIPESLVKALLPFKADRSYV